MRATVAFGCLVGAAILQIVFMFARRGRPDPASHWLLLAAALLLGSVTVERSVLISFAAVTNTYESLVFFAASVCLVLFGWRLIVRRKTPAFVLFGGTIIATALLAVASSPIAPPELQPPIPALQSSWLVLHVTFSFVGEAFFAVSFIAAIASLAARDAEGRASLERVTATAVGIGYPVFTAGALIFGAIWAQFAWGSWWSWDPKETWALVTWLIYTAYLHTRFVRKLRGRVSAILAIVGFAFTVFTFFGVNYLPFGGLHSYAR
jgi:ABC-type transport system involved in cytochrome c biogenesis permease subunit